MPLKEIVDRKGRRFTWIEYDVHSFPNGVRNVYFPQDPEKHLKAVKSLEIRDSDVLICTFPKAGTHWIWEIVSMVTKGTAEYDINPSGAFMPEFASVDKLNSVPSPRVLNTHLAVSCLPDQVFSKHTKIIHVMRNPKDIVTSLYYHVIQTSVYTQGNERHFETFSEYLPYVTGEYGVHIYVSMFTYYTQMMKYINDNPGQVLNLHFEDMKRNDSEAVRKVARFLNKDLPDDVISDIADKCSFKNLKHATETYKQPWYKQLTSRLSLEEQELIAKTKQQETQFYRKGEVGDWKNHFTVAQNEQFDKLLADKFQDIDIEFKYS